MDLKARFGQRLSALREARGLSPHQLATAVGITSQFVGRLESGQRAPSFKILEALAFTVGVDPAEMFQRPRSSKGKPGRPPSLAAAQLEGAASRLGPADLELVLGVVRRLARGA